MRANILATIERKAPTLDHFIGEVGEWVEVARAWVYVEPMRTAERLEQQQIQAHTTHNLRTIWTAELEAVDTACRLRLTTTAGIEKIYQIAEIQNIREQNRELRLVCIEAV